MRVDFLLVACVLVTVALLARCAPAPAPAKPAEVAADPAVRGKYLVTILACNDCHTPFKFGSHGPEPDMARMLSGHPEELVMPDPPKLPEGPWIWTGSATNTVFAGPWGVSYSMNLTPDEDTGIGAWSEEIFVNTLRTGRHWGQSRPILPPMPWSWLSQMTEDDLKAVYAYLRTIPPIKNRVPDAVVAPPPSR